METSTFSRRILGVRSLIPKDFTFLVLVFKGWRWSSVKNTSSLLVFPYGNLFLVFFTQEFVADTLAFSLDIVKNFFDAFVITFLKVLDGSLVFL